MKEIKYYKKIKQLNSLIKELKKNKNKKIIMCHGVFDIVHPGHVRHLIYAKSKADILIVSLTADKFISKGIYRPHVPQDIRAINLAAFEMVDYVIIDNNKTPLKLIKSLKPNFYAKGFEYGSSNISKATIDENKVLKNYGGKILFTPGDIIFSSSKILNQQLPNIDELKTRELFLKKKITKKKLIDIIKNLKKIKVHVVGDTIIDSYTKTSLIGGQIKTPTLSVLENYRDDFLGGAGIVAKHLSKAGADVTLTTVLGDDKFKNFVKNDCKKNNVKLHAICDSNRPSTNKNVIICNDHKLLKIDKVDNQPISSDILNVIIKKIKTVKADIIIFSDFRHGIFNKSTIDILTKSIPKKVIKVADSQVASRWGNICEFKNFDLITPNEREARFALADQETSIGGLTIKLKKKSKYKNLILKLGAKGILSVGQSKNTYFTIGSFANHNVIDAVGSGDALLSYASLVYFKTNSILMASIIGSFAAACECECEGNIPIAPQDLQKKFQTFFDNQ